MKKKIFIFCSILLFNVCVFANNDDAVGIETIFMEVSNEANEANEDTHMCTVSLTKNGVTIEVSAPCSKIVEAAKALQKAVANL
jgi:hypothetical protein